MASDSIYRAAVLVIDDEESLCRACGQALDEAGYLALIAGDADQGLRLAERIRPNVVLVDLKLPGMSGLELLRKMRRTVPGAVPIVITGYGTTQSAVQAMKLGAYDYLCKPFDDQVLLEAVGRARVQCDAYMQSAALEDERQAILEDLAAAIGRDSRTPALFALRWIETVRNKLIGPLAPEQNRALERASQRLSEISRLIRDWHGLGQMGERLAQLRMEAVELGAVIRDSWAAISAAEGWGRIELKVNIPDGEVPVLGEAVLLREMFIHLLSNAVSFIPGPGRITVDAAADGGFIVVSVRDTGRGIPAEGWSWVFEAFYQGACPNAMNTDDSTLGFVAARKIAAAHGGTITVQNGPGSGAAFVVRLPALAGKSEKERAMHKETVVVIDDEESMREGCRQALEGKGYVARMASGGEEGVHLVEELKPEVVLVDLKMPGIDGMETLRRIKQIDPYIVSIVITGYGTIESSVAAMRLGASDFLCKPFDDEQLLTAVEYGLEAHSSQQQETSALMKAREERANRQTIIEVLERAAREQSFAAELMEKGSRALDAYKLSSAEKAAIAAGDMAWIEGHVDKLNERQKSWLIRRLGQERW